MRLKIKWILPSLLTISDQPQSCAVLVSHRILLQMRSTGTCCLHSSSSKLFWDQISLKAVLVMTQQKNNSPTVGPGYSLKIMFSYLIDWNRDLFQPHIWKYCFATELPSCKRVSEGGLSVKEVWDLQLHTQVFSEGCQRTHGLKA